MTFVSRASVAALALSVAALPLLSGTPAQAASAPAASAAKVPCVVPTMRTSAPDWRKYDDTAKVTPQDLAAVPKEETTRRFVRAEVHPELAPTIGVPVYVHVIKGRHRGERVPAGPRKVRRIIATLNRAYAGGQSDNSARTRYRFDLRKIDYTRRDGWYHAFLYGPRDSRAKRKLHRGDARSLNLYVNGGGPKDFPVLGWARFPWQYAARPRLDGVTVNAASLPGGRATGYNLGDTAVHETGHWLGLFHTFQGGCSSSNDMVTDTPAEGEPSYYCETTRDTCAAPGLDPVRNFMDYSLDACMNMFTPGQVRRMDASYEKWRQ